jgi:hypothetical protein
MKYALGRIASSIQRLMELLGGGLPKWNDAALMR